MPILTNLKKTINEKRKNLSSSKKWGIILTVIASVGYAGLFIGVFWFLKSFFLGVFGLFAYILFMALYFIAGLLFKGKQFVFSKKFIVCLSLAFVSLMSIFHMAFSSGINFSNYFAYLGSVYVSKATVGGLLLGLFVYPFQKLLGFGAYFVFGIVLIVCVALIVDYFTSLTSYKANTYSISNKTKPSPLINEPVIKPIKLQMDSSPKDIPLGLNAEIKKEETAKEIALKKLGLDNIKNKRFESEKNINLTQEKNQPIFSASNEFQQPKTNSPEGFTQSFGYNIRTKNSKSVDQLNDDKNRKFLQATFGIKPKINFTANNEVSEEEKKLFNPSNLTDQNNNNNEINKVYEPQETEKQQEIKPIEFHDEELDLSKFQIPKELQLDINNQRKRLSQFNREKENEGVNREDLLNDVNTKPKPHKRVYIKPSFELLNSISTMPENYGEDYNAKAQAIEKTLENFRIPVKLVDITRGPAVTRYEYSMPEGISVNKVYLYANDISMAVASRRGVRIEAPIPGKKTFGIEVPNEHIATVALKDILNSNEFINSKSLTTFGLGKEISGAVKVCDIAKMPHLLIAGSTGSGKSVCLNCLIVSLLYRSSPEDLRFILIDPKRVEFTLYNNLPHLLMPKVITEPEKAISALTWAINEMEKRFLLFESNQVKNLTEYNEMFEVKNGEIEKLPMIIIVIDEVSDLMSQSKKDVEEKITRLAQKARAAGIHLVLATQRPSVDVITGTIKANFPSRIAFCLTSVADSRTILDNGGAEQLLGKGDMLYSPQDASEPIRIQGCFVSDEEVRSVVDYIKQNTTSNFDEEIEGKINKSKLNNGSAEIDENGFDALVPEVLKQFIQTGMASASFIQRRFRVGYNRAGIIIDQLTNAKFISPSDGSNRPRSVYITKEQYKQIFGDTNWDND